MCTSRSTLDECHQLDDLCDQHRAELDRAILERWLRGIIPPHLFHAHPRDLPDAAKAWDPCGQRGVFLYGGVGTGKSHAAAAMLKLAVVKRRRNHLPHTAAWANLPRLILDTLTALARRGDPEALWGGLQRVAILVLDDVGLEPPKDWSRLRLYDLLEQRAASGLPTIVTSNLNLGELAERFDAPQIASRLSGSLQLAFTGRDRRPDAKEPRR